MIEIIKNDDLIELYKQWADEDPVFHKAAEYLENGRIRKSNLNWNVKCRNQIRELRRNGYDWDHIHSLVRNHVSVATLESQLNVNGIAELTARQVYYQLKK